VRISVFSAANVFFLFLICNTVYPGWNLTIFSSIWLQTRYHIAWHNIPKTCNLYTSTVLYKLELYCKNAIQVYFTEGIQVLTEVVMKNSAFCKMTPFIPLKVNYVSEVHFAYISGFEENQAINKKKKNIQLLPASCWLLTWFSSRIEANGHIFLGNVGWLSLDNNNYSPECRVRQRNRFGNLKSKLTDGFLLPTIFKIHC
jgi:hypothetical protein